MARLNVTAAGCAIMHRYAGRHFALGRDGPPPSHSRVLRHAIAGLRRQRHGAEESGAVAATAILGSKRSRPAGPRSRHIGLREMGRPPCRACDGWAHSDGQAASAVGQAALRAGRPTLAGLYLFYFMFLSFAV
jgi:hypothetical protein